MTIGNKIDKKGKRRRVRRRVQKEGKWLGGLGGLRIYEGDEEN